MAVSRIGTPALCKALQRVLKTAHSQHLRRAAADLAQQILETDPTLREATKAVRRDAVYLRLKELDPYCVTSTSARPVADALEGSISTSAQDRLL